MWITFRTLFKGTLRDRISLFWAVVFPIVFVVVLGSSFPTPAYPSQLLTGMLGLSVLFFGLSGIAFESLFQRSSVAWLWPLLGCSSLAYRSNG